MIKSNRSTLGSARKQEPKYAMCSHESHKKEPLNLVCIEPTCKNKGLICAICKTSSHAKHQVKPLKIFIKMLEEFQTSLKTSQTNNNVLTRLNEMYQNILVSLRQAVQKLAESVRDFEIQLIKDYENTCQFIYSEAGNNKIIYEYLQIIRQNPSHEDLTLNINKILASLKYDPVKKTMDKVNIGQEYITQYSYKQSIYIDIIKQLQFDSIKVLNNAKNQTKNQKPKSLFYKFNENLKPHIIKLSENNLTARQTQSNHGDVRFALVEPILPTDKISQITFNVKNKTNWVGLGIAIKSNILSKKFKFNYSTVGHGSYLLSTNGYTWSHTRAEDNIKLKAFSFDTGTNIKVTFDPKNSKVIYTNLDDDKFYQQSIDLTEAEKNGGISFCANLGSHGDQIKIINVKKY